MKDYGNTKFYEALRDADIDSECRFITVTGGEHAGEKVLMSSAGIEWCSDSEGFLASHISELIPLPGNGIFNVDGTEVYAEILGREKHIVVCGAGHVSMPIISIGKMIGCKVTVIDDRLTFVNNAIAQGADEVLLRNFEDALEEISGSEDTYFVLVTRGHRYDRDCLRLVLRKPHAYIGMMGSRRRVGLIMRDLEAEGFAPEELREVYSPIGIDIGAETPEEIAVAIMAQIIAVSTKRKRLSGFPKDILDALLEENRQRFVMATIISRKGSAPRGVGTKMLISRTGDIVGTIGGGCIEGNVIAKGRRMLLEDEHKPVVMEVDITKDTAEDEGMVCGGKIQVLLETV
jgi:xanthine dehydrogenase accessory factor